MKNKNISTIIISIMMIFLVSDSVIAAGCCLDPYDAYTYCTPSSTDEDCPSHFDSDSCETLSVCKTGCCCDIMNGVSDGNDPSYNSICEGDNYNFFPNSDRDKFCDDICDCSRYVDSTSCTSADLNGDSNPDCFWNYDDPFIDEGTCWSECLEGYEPEGASGRCEFTGLPPSTTTTTPPTTTTTQPDTPSTTTTTTPPTTTTTQPDTPSTTTTTIPSSGVSDCITEDNIQSTIEMDGIYQQIGEKAIEIQFIFTLEEEEEPPTKFQLYRCDGTCDLNSNYYLVEEQDYSGEGTVSIFDDGTIDLTETPVGIEWDKEYTYKAGAFYNRGLQSYEGFTIFSNPWTIKMGSEECIGYNNPDIYPISWCEKNTEGTVDKIVGCEKENINGKITSYIYNPSINDCMADGDKSCKITDEGFKCVESPDSCSDGNPFGLTYSSQALSLLFIDSSKTIVDNCYSCANMRNCYDYKSQQSCSDDDCNVASGDCKWKAIYDDISTGVCIDTAKDNCEFCDKKASSPKAEDNPNTLDAYNEIFDICTTTKAQKLGEDTPYTCNLLKTDPPSAVSCDKITCYDYNDMADPQTNCGSAGSDSCGLKICKFSDSKCFKDADSSKNGETTYDDCYNKPEACKKDMVPPVTTIEIIFIEEKSTTILNENQENIKVNIFDPYCGTEGNSECITGPTYFCVDQDNTCSPYPSIDGIKARSSMKVTRSGEEYRIKGESGTPSKGPVKHGINYIRYYSVDNANNPEEVKFVSFVFDNQPPVIYKDIEDPNSIIEDGTTLLKNTHFEVIRTFGSGENFRTEFEITFDTDEASICGFKFEKGGETISSQAMSSCFKTHYSPKYTLAEGSYTWIVTCEDIAGNSKTYTYPITMDNDPSIGLINLIVGEEIYEYKDGIVVDGIPKIQFTTPGSVTCKLDTEDNDYDGMLSNEFTKTKEIVEEETKWNQELATDSLVSETKLYTFYIACEGDSKQAISFTYDYGDTGKPTIEALNTDDTAFDFSKTLVQGAPLILRCLDQPRNGEGEEDTDSYGYGCTIEYCEDEETECTPTRVPKADIKDVIYTNIDEETYTSIKDKQIERIFDKNTTIRFQAIEIKGGEKSSAVKEQKVIIDSHPPVFSFTLTALDDSPNSFTDVDERTPIVTIGVGTYELKITSTETLSANPILTFEGRDPQLELQGTEGPWKLKIDARIDGATARATLKDPLQSDLILFNEVLLGNGDITFTISGYDAAQGYSSSDATSQGNYGNLIHIPVKGYTTDPLVQLNCKVDIDPPDEFDIQLVGELTDQQNEGVTYFKENGDIKLSIGSTSKSLDDIDADFITFYSGETEITVTGPDENNQYSIDHDISEGIELIAKACDGIGNCVDSSNTLKIRTDSTSTVVSNKDPGPNGHKSPDFSDSPTYAYGEFELKSMVYDDQSGYNHGKTKIKICKLPTDESTTCTEGIQPSYDNTKEEIYHHWPSGLTPEDTTAIEYTAELVVYNYAGQETQEDWHFFIDPQVPDKPDWSFKDASGPITPLMDKGVYYLSEKEISIEVDFVEEPDTRIVSYEVYKDGEEEVYKTETYPEGTGSIGKSDIPFSDFITYEDNTKYKLKVWAQRHFEDDSYGAANNYNLDFVIDTTPLKLTLNPITSDIQESSIPVLGPSDLDIPSKGKLVYELDGTSSRLGTISLYLGGKLAPCATKSKSKGIETRNIAINNPSIPPEDITNLLEGSKIKLDNQLPVATTYSISTSPETTGTLSAQTKLIEPIELPQGIYTLTVAPEGSTAMTSSIEVVVHPEEYYLNISTSCLSNEVSDSKNYAYWTSIQDVDWDLKKDSNLHTFFYDNKPPTLTEPKAGTDSIEYPVTDTKTAIRELSDTISFTLQDTHGLKLDDIEISIQKGSEEPITIDTTTTKDNICKTKQGTASECTDSSITVKSTIEFTPPEMDFELYDTYNIKVKVIINDSLDNQQETFFEFSVDKRIPAINTIEFGPSGLIPSYDKDVLEYFFTEKEAEVNLVFEQAVEDSVRIRLNTESRDGNWAPTFSEGNPVQDITRVDSVTYTFNLESLSETDYILEIDATDTSSSNKDLVEFPFTVDLTDPTISSITISGTSLLETTSESPFRTNQPTPAFHIYFTETNPASITATNGANTVTVTEGLTNYLAIDTLPLNENILNTVTITLTDKAGKTVEKTVYIEVDTQGPIMTFSEPLDVQTKDTISAGYTLTESAEVTFLVNGEIHETTTAVGGSNTKVITFTGYAEGIKELTATGSDALGNELELTNSLEVIYDITPPEMTQTDPVDGSRLGNLEVIKVKLEDAAVDVDYTLSTMTVTGAEEVGCTLSQQDEYLVCSLGSPLNAQVADVQEYNVEVIPVDILGNQPTTPLTFTFTIDKYAPVIIFTNPLEKTTYYNTQDRTITGTIEAIPPQTLSLTQYKIGGDYQDLTLTGGIFTITTNLPAPLEGETHTETTVSIKATDNLNKYSEDSVKLVYDPTPPGLTISQPTTPTGEDTINVIGTYSENTGITNIKSITAEIIYYDNSKSTPTVTYASGDFSFDAILRVQPGQGESNNIIKVTITDAAGNINTEEVSVVKQAQLNAPILDPLPSLIGPSSSKLTITGTSDLQTEVSLYINYDEQPTTINVPMGEITGQETITIQGTSVDKPDLEIIEGKKIIFKNNKDAEATIVGLTSAITLGPRSSETETSDEIILTPGTYSYDVKIAGNTITSGIITVNSQTNAFEFKDVELNNKCTLNSNQCIIFVKSSSTTEGVEPKQSTPQIVVYDNKEPIVLSKTPDKPTQTVPGIVSVTIEDNYAIDITSIVVRFKDSSTRDLLSDEYSLTIQSNTVTITLTNPSFLMQEPAIDQENNYELIIELTDTAKNSLTATIQITIDKKPPEITDATITDAVKGGEDTFYMYLPNHKLKVTANEPVRCKYSTTTLSWSEMTPFSGFSSYVTSPISFDLGEPEGLSYSVLCEDEAGNMVKEPYNVKFIFGNKVPIYDISPSGHTNIQNPTITLKTAVEARCLIYDDGWKQMDSPYNQEHSYSTGTLDIGPNLQQYYDYDVKCDDLSGKLEQGTKTVEFTVDKSIPDMPEITGIIVGIEQILFTETKELTVGQATIKITGTAEPGTKVEIMKGSDSLNYAETQPNGNFEVTIILDKGENTLHGVAVDLATNPSPSSEEVIVTYLAEVPEYMIIPGDKDVINSVEELIIYWDKDDFIKTASIDVDKFAEIDGSLVDIQMGTVGPTRVDNTFTFTPSTETFEQGNYSVTVTASDMFDHSTTFKPTTFTVDSRVPEISYTLPSTLKGKRTNQNSINIHLVIESDEWPVTEYQVGSKSKVTVSQATVILNDEPISLPNEGSNDIIITATNERGTARTTLTLIKDTTGADPNFLVQ